MSFWKSLFGGGARPRAKPRRARRSSTTASRSAPRPTRPRGSTRPPGSSPRTSAAWRRSTSSSAPTATPPTTTRSSSRSPRRARSWTSRASGCSSCDVRRRNETRPRIVAAARHRHPMKHVLVLLNARAGTLIDIGAARIVEQIESALKPHCERLDVRLLPPRELRRAIARCGDRTARYRDRRRRRRQRQRRGCGVLGRRQGARRAAVRDHEPAGARSRHAGRSARRGRGARATPRRAGSTLRRSTAGRSIRCPASDSSATWRARARRCAAIRSDASPACVLAWFRALRRTAPFSIDIVVDGRRERVTALAALVTNNRFAPDWRRPRLDEGVLEMHIVEDQGTLTKLKAARRAAHRRVARRAGHPQHRGARDHGREPAPAHPCVDRRRAGARAAAAALSRAARRADGAERATRCATGRPIFRRMI